MSLGVLVASLLGVETYVWTVGGELVDEMKHGIL